MDEALSYFLDLRVRMRRNPEGRAIVDRCIRLIACAGSADAATMRLLEAEVEALRGELLARFGAPRPLCVH